MQRLKDTEVGPIPETWDCVAIASVARLESGHTPSKRVPAYWGGHIPWVSLHDTQGLDKLEVNDTVQKITSDGMNNSSARLLPKGTVIFSRTATIGKCTILGQEMTTSQDFANYVCGPRVNNVFLVYLFRSMQKHWRNLMAGSTHNTIYMPAFKSLQIPLPPLPEQRAIAEALTDADALLDVLDRLIAKKRDLKQAAMQQLLTGQTRLPGFSGKWEVKRLGNHVRFLRNGMHSRAELRPDGPVRYLHYGDIHTTRGLFITPTMLPSLPVEKAISLNRLQDGDLIFADASEDMDGVSKSVELRNVGTAEVVSGQHTIAARFDRSVLADGFKGLLQFCPTFAAHLRRLAAGTKVYATNRAHIASAEIFLPDTDEQTAIATVVSDINTEIEALEARRTKTAAVKQGMMQELLTGRTRLV